MRMPRNRWFHITNTPTVLANWLYPESSRRFSETMQPFESISDVNSRVRAGRTYVQQLEAKYMAGASMYIFLKHRHRFRAKPPKPSVFPTLQTMRRRLRQHARQFDSESFYYSLASTHGSIIDLPMTRPGNESCNIKQTPPNTIGTMYITRSAVLHGLWQKLVRPTSHWSW